MSVEPTMLNMYHPPFDSLLRFHEPESNVNVDDHHKVKEDRSVVSSTYINAYVSST